MPRNFEQCVAEVVAGAGGKITDREAVDILDRVASKVEELQRESKTIMLQQKLKELTEGEAKTIQINAIKERQHAIANAVIRAQVQTFIDAYVALRPGKYQDALISYLEGSNRQLTGARRSVASTTVAYEAWFHGAIMGQISKEKPHLEKMLGDEAFNDMVAREMESPRSTGNKDAEWLARRYSDTAEVARRVLNRLGANIGKLENWRPQTHDAWRMIRAGRTAWIDTIQGHLDLDKTFPDVAKEEIPRILGNIWDTIVADMGSEKTARERGVRTGPANLAKRLGEHRVLHFKQGEHWSAYNKEFGYGTVTSSMFKHLSIAARTAAQMEMLGPNPRAMLASLAESLRRDAKGNLKKLEGKALLKAKNELDGLRHVENWSAWAVMTNDVNVPINYNMALAGSGWRAWQMMAKLGGAVISAMGDTVNLINNLRFNGKPAVEAWAEVFRGYFRGRGDKEARELAFLYGEGWQGIVEHHFERYSVGETAPGRIARLTTRFFRWTGLTGFTDIGRSVATRIMAADMGRMAAHSWDKLPERYRMALDRQGFTAAKWDLIRSTAYKAENGSTYITPEQIDNIPDNLLDAHLSYPIANTDLALHNQVQALQAQTAREADWVERRLEKLQLKVERTRNKANRMRQEADDTKIKYLQSIDARVAHQQAEMDAAKATLQFLRGAVAAKNRDEIDAVFNSFYEGEIDGISPGSMRKVGRRLTSFAATEAYRLGQTAARARAAASKAKKLADDYSKEVEARLGKEIEADIARMKKRSDEFDAFATKMKEFAKAREDIIAKMPQRRMARVATLREDLKRELKLDLYRFISDEARFGIIEADAATRRFTTLGQRPGTVGGEAIRALMQFKGFPIAFTQRVWGRALFAGPKGMAKYAHIGEMLTGLLVAGLFTAWAKDVIGGKSPREIYGEEGLNMKVLTSAITQSGGAGIYGDFLFGEVNRHGGGLLGTVAGPAFGDAFELAEKLLLAKQGDVNAGEWLNIATSNIPFQNFWITKAATDILFMNSIKETIAPGYLERQEQRARENYGQEYFLPRQL